MEPPQKIDNIKHSFRKAKSDEGSIHLDSSFSQIEAPTDCKFLGYKHLRLWNIFIPKMCYKQVLSKMITCCIKRRSTTQYGGDVEV